VKIIYSLPHPADRLGSAGAGHTVRATAVLDALEQLGHEVIRLEAATEGSTKAAVSFYRNVIKKLIPRPIAMRMRDTARIANSRRYAQRLIEKINDVKPNLVLETHIAFSLSAKLASESTGIPYMLDDVAPSWEEQKLYGVGLAEEAIKIHREMTGGAKLLVAVNQSMKQNLLKDGLPEDKIVVAENGIDSRIFHSDIDGSAYRQKWGIPASAIVIVFVGSFQPYHRVDLLLQSFAKLKTDQEVRLLLVGEGQKSAESKALVQQLNLMDRVIFTGTAPYTEVPNYLASGDITIMPATNEYGNPMKIYEYMALGKVVVAPDQPTITEIIRHDYDGYLFKREDTDEMAKALKTLIETPALRVRLGKQAEASAAEHTWVKRAERIVNALKQKGMLDTGTC
jgi:glycosyltransferase involved in cell wall biosynthesis